ncbi:ty3-gypsy retroelement transposase [Cucumis melo var. makuwa]|uniref:Ty3-gypsy retroelement transposase n=1 Tax=Cucumis melo var. makuwa TaxID=1194695 RepID=A0A5A7UR44_CUCMM|nr:ty3-gypsy retroelement transposase [Cucumis melo var. makuwa]TYK22490.1 ty3-gypsy retroelement transposase [Cucumis melo var. makuwa]
MLLLSVQLLWIILVASFATVIIQSLAGNLGVVTGDDLQTYAYVLLGPFESYAYARCEYFVGSFELTMKVRGTIHGEKVVVLIDCGATHNYGVILGYGAAVKGKGVGRS